MSSVPQVMEETASLEPIRKPSTKRQLPTALALIVQNRKAAAGVAILLVFVLMAIFGPMIAPHDPADFIARPRQGPSSEYWFGTTSSGQDVFSQTIVGARISLGTGLLVGGIVTIVSAIVGMTAGYFGGRVDDLLSLLTNVVLIIPSIPLLIILAAFLPAGFWTIVAVLSVTGWSWGARVLRSQTLSLREKDFVASAKVAGENAPTIIFREILPNMTSLLVAGFFGAVICAIGAQAGLEFLGLGNPSSISWGTNLYWAQNNSALLTGAWWTIVPSGTCIALVAFSFALINYAIDEVTNPRLRSQRQTAQVLRKLDRKARHSRATPVISKGVEA